MSSAINLQDFITPEHILLHSKARSQSEAFQELAMVAARFGYAEHWEDILKGLQAREAEVSTGLEDNFAIPHARIPEITKAGIFYVQYDTPLEWNAFNQQPTQIAIYLLIPQVNSGADYLAILSYLAQQLMGEQLRQQLKQATTPSAIIDLLCGTQQNIKPVSAENNTDKGYVIAITACPAGVAHTYMAAKAIEDLMQEKGYKCKVEKQGANGFEDKLTSEDVANANALLIAADVNPLELERFEGIPQLRVSVADPVHNIQPVWAALQPKLRTIDNNAFLKTVGNKQAKRDPINFKLTFKKEIKGLKDAVLTGISYAVPVIVAGTTIMAIQTIISSIWGSDVIKTHADWINTLGSVAGGALSILLAPILAAYIAYAMADKPGMTVGFMSGLGCNAIVYYKHMAGQDPIAIVSGLGFLGGLISGILVGYMMRLARKYIVSKKFQGVLTWFVYPVLGSLIILLFILFVIGQPIALLIGVIFDGLSSLQHTKGAFAIGIIVGMLCNFDMGGPFNKLAWAFSIASFTQAFQNGQLIHPELLVPYSSFWAAGIQSGWTTTIVTQINKKHSEKAELESGRIAWILSSLGIGEGSIPFVLSDPLRVIPCFLIGGAVSGGLAAGLGLGSDITGGGFITMAGVSAVNGAFPIWLAIILWLITAIVGCAISTGLILLLKLLKRKPELDKKCRYYTLKAISLGVYRRKSSRN